MPKLGKVFQGKPGGRSRVWWPEPCVRERKKVVSKLVIGAVRHGAWLVRCAHGLEHGGLKLHALGLEHGGLEVPKLGMRGGLELACAGLRIGGLEAPGPACIGAERNWASVRRGLALGKLATCAWCWSGRARRKDVRWALRETWAAQAGSGPPCWC
ncbi:unnamed protein product [Prunus armeniaca]